MPENGEWEDLPVLSGTEEKTCTFDDIRSKNPHLLAAKKLAEEAAELDRGMLIVGEPGTEKELFARAVHQASSRAAMPFLELDCVHLPDALLEWVMFGREAGTDLQPIMKHCRGGTLFVQEVGALPLVAQSRTARAFDTGKVDLGSGEDVAFDCRVMASTSEDLLPLLEDKKFRQDLYNALTEVVIFIPPLRHRKEDIPLLVHKFIRQYGRDLGKRLNNISDEAMHALVHYRWPGNVSELEAVIGRSALLAKGETVLMHHLPQAVQESRRSRTGDAEEPARPLSLATIEKRHIQKVLDYTGWHKVRSAQILGIDRSTLYDKIRRYNLVDPADRVLQLARI